MHIMIKKYFVAVVLLSFFGCQKYENGVPINKNDQAPPPVSNVEVQNLPGGATISYKLPQSENLLYVMAEYSIHDSIRLNKKASYYNNSLTIEGFPDTKTYDVQLYAVSRGGKKSDPVTVKVKPLTPPVVSVFMSLVMKPTFGGVNVSFLNESGADIKINVLTTDSLGNLYPADIFYTQSKKGNFSTRGFAAEKRKFGVFVRDRWNNYSDTLFADITPFFEQKLNKTKFKGLPLPTDTYQPHLDDGLVDLWDDVWDVPNPVFHTKPNTGIPQWFSFDMGVTARLSRFKFYHRLARSSGGTDGAYYAGDPEEFEIWGSNNPSADGSWDNWILLGHFVSKKPSGSATPTSEDLQFACVDGEDFEFPLDIPPVRYLRFKTLKNWGGVTYVYISELTFWGSEQ
jgi:hypothetical protein